MKPLGRVALAAVAFVLLAPPGLPPGHARAVGHDAPELRQINPPPRPAPAAQRPDQLPHSRVARGAADIAAAWLAGPTARYPHGVLGDRIEAARLVVDTHTGQRIHIELPPTRVFEDLEPRIVDLDGDGREEILVVESDAALGAALAVYGIVDGQLARIAATPFIGQANRWLNPLGTGDFSGDGRIDIALVATPHIGGILRLYRYAPPRLELFAEYRGVSTHAIGSTELGLGQVVAAQPRQRLLAPDQRQRTLLLLEWTLDGWERIQAIPLPGRIVSSLVPSGDGRWRFGIDDGRHFEIRVPD